MPNVGALILGAGYSSRMGFYKALLPLDTGLVGECAIKTFDRPDIVETIVVMGHNRNLLSEMISHLPLKYAHIKPVYNSRFKSGMFSSVQVGTKAISEACTHFFLLPMDYPLISEDTITILMKQLNTYPDVDVIFPTYHGVKGHPPLISMRLVDLILRSEPEEGLRSILQDPKLKSHLIETLDPEILNDLDHFSDYQKCLSREKNIFPSPDEARKLLNKYQKNEIVIEHCKSVSTIACLITEKLNANGMRLNMGLIYASALLHDIAKGLPKHAHEGAELLINEGYLEAGEIVREHMVYGSYQSDSPLVNEKDIVYLADKMIEGTQWISIADRKKKTLEKYRELPKIDLERIEMRLNIAESIQVKIETITKCDLNRVCKSATYFVEN